MSKSNLARRWARHRTGAARWTAALAAALTVAGTPAALAQDKAPASSLQQRPQVQATDKATLSDTQLRPQLQTTDQQRPQPQTVDPRDLATRPALSPTTKLPRQLSPRRAMVIVVEENNQQGFSVSWQGLARSVLEFDYGRLMPSNIRSLVMPVVDATVQVAGTFGLPAATLADEISSMLVRDVSRMLGQHLGTVAASAGLPAGGCAREMFGVLANRGIQSGEDPFKAFINVYGETVMSDCLKAMAEPYYDTVVVLTDDEATFSTFSNTLLNLHRNNHVIDILINVHGCGSKSGRNSSYNNVACNSPRLVFHGAAASPQKIREIRASNGGQPLNINAVYQVSCWGSEFNDDWEYIGAKAANGARELNYYVLLSPFVFLDRFTRGNRTLRDAALDAYNAERTLLGGQTFTVRLNLKPFLDRMFPPPTLGLDLIAGACPGGTRDGCSWSFTPLYGSALNYALAQVYGYDKNKPVNHSASSARVHRGVADLRRAGT
ncbi:MAG TPA: hypothetical protein VKZ85_10085 [Woeseiaceae bacterium]|nr:hypothetical protein [Woeseiaceae bacterium]